MGGDFASRKCRACALQGMSGEGGGLRRLQCCKHINTSFVICKRDRAFFREQLQPLKRTGTLAVESRIS